MALRHQEEKSGPAASRGHRVYCRSVLSIRLLDLISELFGLVLHFLKTGTMTVLHFIDFLLKTPP